MNYLQCIEIETGPEPTASIIWLHGLGASGDDFAPVIPELNLSGERAIRFIFPHAPEIPVTINGGYIMPAWYDILEMNIERKIDEDHLLGSVEEVGKLINREIERGVESHRIIIIGFSQGGAVAYHTALTFPQKLGGLMGLSTYFATAKSINPHEANKAIPISVNHGTHDPMVIESLGNKGYQTLVDMGYQAAYKTYPMEHNVCLEQLRDIGKQINEWLK